MRYFFDNYTAGEAGKDKEEKVDTVDVKVKGNGDSVCFTKCNGTRSTKLTFNVSSEKCANLELVNCSNVILQTTITIAQISLINCKKCNIVCAGATGSFSIDKSDDCLVSIVQSETKKTEINESQSAGCNVMYEVPSGEKPEIKEYALPAKIQTKWVGGDDGGFASEIQKE